MTRRYFGLWLIGAALLASPAAADPPLLPGIGQHDARIVMDVHRPPWTSLVLVQTTELHTIMRCTGFLVAPQEVVTAAHCVFSGALDRFVPPHEVHVLAGYDKGDYVQHVLATRIRSLPGFDYHHIHATAGLDAVVLDLAAPLAGSPLRLMTEVPPRTPVTLGGYNQDRAQVIEADDGCRVMDSTTDSGGHSMLMHDCNATHGTSGAPLLVPSPNGAWQVAGLQESVSGNMALGFAVPAATIARLLAPQPVAH